MKKKVLIIGGNSKIARTFIKKYKNKYDIDVTIHDDKEELVKNINYFYLNLANVTAIKNLTIKLKKYNYDGVLFFASVYSMNANYKQAEFLKIIKINFLSCLNLISNLKLNKNSKIIFFTDEGITQPKNKHFFYSFSKALLENYIRILAVDFAPHTSIIGIGLGPIMTDKDTLLKKKFYLKSLISIKNPCSGLIKFINFILSEKNFYLTGKIIPFDGGAYINRLN
ncbi:MAG: SDR family oxidoreductase [Candidatus Roizmanbacteria bacterium]|nr:MAG: SDR family oxidoreductase [Candidatus Roizmanbacteria bacterium]